jgi:hypothetical protein
MEMRITRARSAEILVAAVIFFLCCPAFAGNRQQIPSADGGVGTCHADFTVHDKAGNPVYNAQIQVTIHYGLFNLHKTDLQVGTNSDGNARFTGLPNFSKKPLEFEVKSGTVSRELTDDPSTNCSASFDVMLAAR